VTDHRRLGVDLFNEVWRLIETRAEATLAAPHKGHAGSARVSDLHDDRMLHAAHASRFHWEEAPECKPENLARGEWQVSRVYTVLGRAEPAIWHARRCLEHCEQNGIGDWDLAYAYEALARAHALAGDGEAEQWKSKSRAAGDAIADPEDREHFDEDYSTLP
jgi:hypothetical protein